MSSKNRKKSKTAKEIMAEQESSTQDNTNSDAQLNIEGTTTETSENQPNSTDQPENQFPIKEDETQQPVSDNQLQLELNEEKPSRASAFLAIIAGVLLLIAGWSIYNYFSTPTFEGKVDTQEDMKVLTEQVQEQNEQTDFGNQGEIESNNNEINSKEENDDIVNDLLPNSDESNTLIQQETNNDEQADSGAQETPIVNLAKIKTFLNSLFQGRDTDEAIQSESELAQDTQNPEQIDEIDNNNQIQKPELTVEPSADRQNPSDVANTYQNVSNSQGEITNIKPINQESDTPWQANDYVKGDIQGETYTVVRGDTLWEISEAVYGSGTMWHKIADANNVSYLSNGNPLIVPGQVLTLPPI